MTPGHPTPPSVGVHSTRLGAVGSRVVFLHGLFGQGKNWTTIAKALSSDHRVTMVDLPDHGRSAWTDQVSYAEMARAVGEVIADESSAPATVVGHSMGGKVAMALALLRPDAVERLVVVDIAPVRYPELSNFADYVRGMRALDLQTLPDRPSADRALQPYVPDETIRSFLLQNLRRVREGGSPGWRWQLNLDLLGDRLGDLGDWTDLHTEPYPGPVLWLAGSQSSHISAEYAPAMRALFPRVQLVTVKNAGHWVHSEQPTVFAAVLRRFLQR